MQVIDLQEFFVDGPVEFVTPERYKQIVDANKNGQASRE